MNSSQRVVHEEFSFVGVFDDHEDGALRYAMLLSAKEQKSKVIKSETQTDTTITNPPLVKAKL